MSNLRDFIENESARISERADILNDEAIQREDDEFSYLHGVLTNALIQATSWREHNERSLKSILPPNVPWLAIEAYADAAAKEYLARRKLEDLGFAR